MRYIIVSILLCLILVGEGSFSATKGKIAFSQLSQHSQMSESDQSDDVFTAGALNSQTVANSFRHFKQQTPEYFVVVEFFAEDWSAALYQQLIDSGESEPWFINTSFSPKRQRISGWKDGNLLYKKGFFQAA